MNKHLVLISVLQDEHHQLWSCDGKWERRLQLCGEAAGREQTRSVRFGQRRQLLLLKCCVTVSVFHRASRGAPPRSGHSQRAEEVRPFLLLSLFLTHLKGPLLYCFSSIYYRSQIYTKYISEVFGSKYQTDHALQHPINPSVFFKSADSLSVTLDENKEPLPTPLWEIFG